jgi:putative Mg2+ transporter-C (MgtC) family protein
VRARRFRSIRSGQHASTFDEGDAVSSELLEAAAPGSVEVIARLVVAAVLGGLLGAERELDGQDAGLRTHLLLSLGASLFGVISVGAFSAFIVDPADANVRVDVTRIASYVAAGIGFIGGGAIVKYRGSVSGITTATSLWTTAAVGLAVGVGFWIAAVTATVLSLVALRGLKPLSNLLARHSQKSAAPAGPQDEGPES